MSTKTEIQWTDSTWNPVSGCSIVSPGCTNCYAMKVANGLERRFNSPKYRGLTKAVNGNPVWTGEVRLDQDALLIPLKWKKPRRIFVNSMSDLFHESLPDEAIDKVFAVMALCPQHTFQCLTKRAERMRSYCRDQINTGRWRKAIRTIAPDSEPAIVSDPLPNCWLGISCERQQEADERIPLLLQTPAAVRFISAEPLLGPIDLIGTLARYQDSPQKRSCAVPLGKLLLDWVIVGGESGKSARPMHPDWARSLRDQCEAAGISFFFKQWGEWADTEDWPSEMQEHLELDGKANGNSVRVGKKSAGRLLDGVEWNQFPSTNRTNNP